MKKKYSALLGIAIVVAGLFVAQPASAATGSWQSYPSSFTVPSNWHCGSSKSGNLTSAQACVVRSGNYAQAVTIVRNNAGHSVSVQASTYLSPILPGAGGDCAASSMAPYGVSVCFAPTVHTTYQVRAWGTVNGGAGAITGYLPVSPYA